MVIATGLTTNMKTQEQMTETILQDDNLQKTSSQLIENTKLNGLINADETSEEVPSTETNNLTGTGTVSVDATRNTTSASSSRSGRKQPSTSTIKDECEYVGDVYGDKKHGKGVLSWPDGRTYTGTFFADRRHGFGVVQTPNISEFKGLYCHDERFGPGILLYNTLQCADVGFWLNEDLIRILYSHPKLTMDIHITDKKCLHSTSLIMPSWYAPQELLTFEYDLEYLLKNKTPTLFCNTVEDDNSTLARYIFEHSDLVQEAIHDKRAQLDAFLSSIYDKQDEHLLKEKLLKDRTPDILPPNETFEQKQLYYYANKFWPFKQRAAFPIDDIISNTRSSFPNPGPLEKTSLTLFENSYYGLDKNVRDLLMQRAVYVDVCDSHGYTALHFAVYNVHIAVINILLDFGANVNQLSDDGLTPLTIAFLLYYGNDPRDTNNTALEHKDPTILNPRASIEPNSTTAAKPPNLANSSINFPSATNTLEEDRFVLSLEAIKIHDVEKQSSYGYDLTDNLRKRIRDERFRESVYTLILLLLRRGADPSRSDWPLPVLAMAIRAGDKNMVELLLKRKTQVNCHLDAKRQVGLTPLHIACGSLSSNAIDIVRLLLEHDANIDAETSLGNKEYLTLMDPLISDLNRPTDVQQHGRTPLHVACTRDATPETLEIVRLLLEHHANPNIVCNGQTPLSLAIALGNQPLVELLLNHENTDPSIPLGYGNGNSLCTLLSIFFEPGWTFSRRAYIIDRLVEKSSKTLYPIRFGPKNIVGSAVDFAYHMFASDTRISQTPYHALSSQERIVYNERKELIAYLAKRFREEATKNEGFLRIPTPLLGDRTRTTSPSLLFPPSSLSRAASLLTEKAGEESARTNNLFRYCATCGRSIGVRLTPCKRCQKVWFCSKLCKVNGWNAFHRQECLLTPSRPSQLERPITTTVSLSTKSKLPSILSGTVQTDHSSSPTAVTPFEHLINMEHTLFKGSVLSINTPIKPKPNSRLPPLTAAQLIRQKRLKQLSQPAGNFQSSSKTSLNGTHLSWNHAYNAPENYSFN